jgi:hypothetical protein
MLCTFCKEQEKQTKIGEDCIGRETSDAGSASS